MQCLLLLSSLLTVTDCGIVADDIGINAIFSHYLKQPQWLLLLSSLLTGTDGGTVAYQFHYTSSPEINAMPSPTVPPSRRHCLWHNSLWYWAQCHCASSPETASMNYHNSFPYHRHWCWHCSWWNWFQCHCYSSLETAAMSSTTAFPSHRHWWWNCSTPHLTLSQPLSSSAAGQRHPSISLVFCNLQWRRCSNTR